MCSCPHQSILYDQPQQLPLIFPPLFMILVHSLAAPDLPCASTCRRITPFTLANDSNKPCVPSVLAPSPPASLV